MRGLANKLPKHAARIGAVLEAVSDLQAGELPREWAEGIARLEAMPPPANVPPRRWEQFIDDAARFADRWADPQRTMTADERVALRGLRREISAMLAEEGAA